MDRLEGNRHFRDRRDAGEQLARRLTQYADADTVVYALPRGGVVLGAVVANALHVPLEVLIARKVGHPANPEYAVCAVTETGEPVCNPAEQAVLDSHWLVEAIGRERHEAARRRERYIGTRSLLSAAGKTAILVDDGIATGLTMRAAIREVKAQGARRIVVAVPVIPHETAAVLAGEVDDVIAVSIPVNFIGAVGAYYQDFRQVTDEEVIRLLQCDPPRLFNLPGYDALADKLRAAVPLEPGSWDITRFPNGELSIALHASVMEQSCLVLASLSPPDARLVETLLLCHTLRKEGAQEVTLLAPYLAYTRQDRDEPGHSKATAWIGALLQAAGVGRVITVDVHSPRVAELYPIPLLSLSPALLFAAEILRLGWQDAAVVAPDEGARTRAEVVRAAVGMAHPLAVMMKTRDVGGVTGALQGQVATRAIIVDDILDTGATLIACAQALQHAGVQEIMVLVTHALFTGDVWPRLWEYGVTRLCCLDTLPVDAARLDKRIHVLRSASLLTSYLLGTGGSDAI